MSSLLAIAAHPGDAVFTMGLAVAQHVAAGGGGIFMSLSLGERGHSKIPPAAYGRMQREATEKASALLGAEAAFLSYPDAEIPLSDEVALRLADDIRRLRPGVIVTHWSGSWHKDHQNCHALVRDAVFYAGLASLERAEPAHGVARLYFAENWEDMSDFAADTYLDVSGVYEKWSAACEAFPMWRGETGFRYNDYYRALAVMRGCLSGFRYAMALASAADQRERRVHTLG